MSVKALSWFAQSVATEGLDDAQSFAQALGMRVLAATGTAVILTTDLGDVVEYCGPGHDVPGYLFRSQRPVAGFSVSDLNSARKSLESAGFAAISDVIAGDDALFQHFDGPGGSVVALIEVTAAVE